MKLLQIIFICRIIIQSCQAHYGYNYEHHYAQNLMQRPWEHQNLHQQTTPSNVLVIPYPVPVLIFPINKQNDNQISTEPNINNKPADTDTIPSPTVDDYLENIFSDSAPDETDPTIVKEDTPITEPKTNITEPETNITENEQKTKSTKPFESYLRNLLRYVNRRSLSTSSRKGIHLRPLISSINFTRDEFAEDNEYNYDINEWPN